MPVLPVRIDRDLPEPLGVQLSTAIRDLVLRGTLRPGDRLPSTRALATDLGVARSITEQAYDQLIAEGWALGRRGSGTFVASGAAPPSTRPRARTAPAPSPDLITLDLGSPWVDPRHLDGWRRAWREVSALTPPSGYPDPRGIPELRAALAERLGRTRGLSVGPEEVLITAGTTDGLRQLLPHLPAGPVGVDDPGYRAAVACVEASGRTVRDLATPGPYDVRGLAGIYVTPAHQHPLGHVLAAPDRLDLLAQARAHGTVVIEDDYDSEFRYDVAPIPALTALDREVAYLGTASKSVGPSLRIGWLVPPPSVLPALVRQRSQTYDMPSWPTQRALLALLREGWVDKVVRTARRVYADRAPRVEQTLAAHARPAGPAAGMYSTWLMPPARVRLARQGAQDAGFALAPLARYCRTARLSGIVLGFGGVTDLELDRALTGIGRALDEA